jgi:hypothetical protein
MTSLALHAAEVATRLRRNLESQTGGMWTVTGPYLEGQRVLRDNAGRYKLTVAADGDVSIDVRDRHGKYVPAGYLRPVVDPTVGAVLATEVYAPVATTPYGAALAERYGDLAAIALENAGGRGEPVG